MSSIFMRSPSDSSRTACRVSFSTPNSSGQLRESLTELGRGIADSR